jgi:hypothetical protein
MLSQPLIEDPQLGFSDANPRPGFFAGASNVDASHGVFVDVTGDFINVGSKVGSKLSKETNDC